MNIEQVEHQLFNTLFSILFTLINPVEYLQYYFSVPLIFDNPINYYSTFFSYDILCILNYILRKSVYMLYIVNIVVVNGNISTRHALWLVLLVVCCLLIAESFGVLYSCIIGKNVSSVDLINSIKLKRPTILIT